MHVAFARGNFGLRVNGICDSGVPIEESHLCVDGVFSGVLIPQERRADAL